MQPPPGRVRIGIPLALAAAFPTALPAAAQQASDEPIIVGVQDRWQSFKFEPIRFALDLSGRYERNIVKDPDGSELKDTYSEVRGTISAWTTGFVGHPNLLELNLAGTFGLSQQWIRSETVGRDEDPLQTVDEYDLSAVILRESDFPTTVYSFRTHNYLDQQFGDTIESEATQSGIRAVLRSDYVPSTFHYYHRNEEQNSQLNLSNFEIVQDTFEWDSQWKPAENQLLTWDYTLDNVEQSGDLRATSSFLRQTGIAFHTLDFGDALEHQLRSSLYFYTQSGDQDLNRIRLDEGLRLRHSPRLESLYDYSFDYADSNGSEQYFNRLSAGVRHKLFESLWTSANLGGTMLDAPQDDFNSSQLFGDLKLDYRKRIPYGLLQASLGGGFAYQVDSDRGSPIDVIDQSFSFPPSGIIAIQQQNVVGSSIVVTDPSGFITYTEGIDYTVQEFPDRVEIRRVIGGMIPAGQAVLIDYQIGPQPGADTTTLVTTATLRYDFEETFLRGLGVYMRYLHQDQDRRSDDPDVLLPANVDDLILGADYRLGYLYLSAEQEWRDSSLSPYNATRFTGEYLHPLGIGSVLDLYGSYDRIDRTLEENVLDIIYVRGRWVQRIGHRTTLNLTATWRNEQESIGTEVNAYEQGIELVWQYRQTSIRGSFRNSIVDSNGVDTTYQTLEVALRREF